MRSPVSRPALEHVLRGTAFALLAFCAWALGVPGRTAVTAVEGSRVEVSLPRWSRRAPADTLHVRLTTAPEPRERAWLRALAGAGTAVTWSGAVVPTAIEAAPMADPAGGVRVLAAAPSGADVRLADSLGTLDSVRAGRAGAAFTLPAHRGGLAVEARTQRAALPAADSLLPRHAAVIGRAGWESRFAIAALEERGWTVDAALRVAPGIAVTQGRVFPLDTARQSVVVALDSLAPRDAAAVAAFVARGGGAVLNAAAARSAPGLAAGGVGVHVRASELRFSAATPTRALALDPVLPRADAVVLERSGPHVVVAARRAGAGRLVQIGWDETWRWRMADVAGSADAHRDWWAGVVAAAAYRPRAGVGAGERGSAAPLAALVEALGPARPAPAAGTAARDLRPLLPLAAALLLLALVAEWGSRRLRGAA